MRDELVGDLRECHLGDVELVLGDQAEQQVERAFEVLQMHLEAVSGWRRGGRLADQLLEGTFRHRASTSLAS